MTFRIMLFALLILPTVAREGATFARTGEVLHVSCATPPGFTIKSESDILGISNPGRADVRPGDLIAVDGRITFGPRDKRWLKGDRISVIRHGRAPEPLMASIESVRGGGCDNRVVRIEGAVIGEFDDDLDRTFRHLLLSSSNSSIIVSVPVEPNVKTNRYLLSSVVVTGLCSPNMGDFRAFHGRSILANLSDIIVTKPAPDDPFAFPELETIAGGNADRIVGLSYRRLNGHVIVGWHGDQFLLAADDGRNVTVTLEKPGPLPVCGQHVCVVGLPDTDLVNINLANASWKATGRDAGVCTVEKIEPDSVFPSSDATRPILPDCHGKSVTLRTTVRGVPRSDFSNDKLYVEYGNRILPIDISSCPAVAKNLEIGCVVTLSAICILDAESWRPSIPFPKIRGFLLVVRQPGDITILSRPTWWTPRRLMTALAILLALLLGILCWNRSLQRLADRRGQDIAASAIAKAESDLKTYERTHLAIELHDSIAQNLTGASLALRGGNYDLAARTLDACREDLRNCMWDLRNLTLEDTDINEAIRKTLEPHTAGARLDIRFNVPRERFTDNTVHTILRILRELAINAVRHGHAANIRIAGSIDGDRLLFSVLDNGCGFDPAIAKGMEYGHFGIQGIRDRIDGLEGEVVIDSAPGRGTKVTIAIKTEHA